MWDLFLLFYLSVTFIDFYFLINDNIISILDGEINMEFSDVLKNEYNSQFIKSFSYKGNTYIKAMEVSKNDFTYR